MTDILSWIRSPGPFLVGHRGFPGAAPENTPASFEAALEAGCDGVELDVRLTRDGVAVVHHDPDLPGDTGPVSIEGTDWADLDRPSWGSGPGSYRLYRLAEILEGLAGRALINVEIKPPGRGRHALTARVVDDILSAVRPRESILISSFDGEMLAALGLGDRSRQLGFLFSERKAFNHLEEEETVDLLAALHPRHDLVDPTLMKRAAQRGLVVHTWTVDDPAEAQRVLDLGVASVITNRPDLLGDLFYPAPEE